MAANSYPDVTIADPPKIEHRICARDNEKKDGGGGGGGGGGTDHEHIQNKQQQQQQQQQNQGTRGVDTFVILQPNRRLYSLSRGQILIAVIIIVLTLVIAVLVTAFVSQVESDATCPACKQSHLKSVDDDGDDKTKHNHHDNGSEGDTTSSSSSSSQFPNNIADPDKPWAGIRLPRSFLPTKYDLRLKVDLTTFDFQGSVNVTLRVNHSSRYLVFHRDNLNVDSESITLTSTFSSPRRSIVRQFEKNESHFHVLELDREVEAGTSYTLTIGYFKGVVNTNLRGLYRSSYTVNGTTRYLAASQLQATDARQVFPCFDEPDMKSKFQVSIVYQDGYTALTNMPPTSTSRHSPGWMLRQFDVTPKMSTYLLAFVIADFRSRNYTFPHGYQLRIWARRDAYDQTKHALDFAIKTYQFFTGYFNISDDVPKADHVAVPDFSSGAMENWGLVIYRETSLLYAPKVSSSQNKFTVTLIVAHEIAHTWFGNMVTMEWWDDLWLNEGFASLLMYIAMDHVYPQWDVFAIMVVEYVFPVMVKDALTTSHPVSARINNPEEIRQHFDSISYNKGMAVLRMMLSFVGKDNFRNALRLYVKRYRFGNANMSQLWSTFREFLNQTFDIARIMDTWTRQMGYPVVNVVEAANGQLDLHQSRFLLDSHHDNQQSSDDNPLGYKWYIPFTYVTQDEPSDPKLVWLNLGSASITKPKRGWLLGNHQIVGFYRVNYERNMWGLMAQQLMDDHTLFPDANRAGLIDDAFALARANKLDYEVALNLTLYLKHEQRHVPWEAFAHSIEFLKGMLSREDAYVQLQQYLRDLVSPIFDAVFKSARTNLPDKYLRRDILTMACDVGVSKAVDYAKSMFDNWMNHNAKLDTDLSMIIYSVGIREGDYQEWNYVWNKARHTSVAAERDTMLESLAYTQKPWLLSRYLNWLFDPDKIRKQDVRVVFGYFTKTPLARMVALDFLVRRWDDLLETFQDGYFVLRDVISGVTVYVNNRYHLEQLERLFEDNPPSGASKAVENAKALIKTNIGWMEDNYDEIKQWLDRYKE